MNEIEGMKRFEAADGLPNYTAKFSAVEAVGFAHLMVQLNQMGLLQGALNHICKKFFDAGKEVADRVFKDYDVNARMTVGDQMKVAEKSDDKGCEVELKRTELVILSGMLLQFGNDPQQHDSVVGKVIADLVKAGKETVTEVEQIVATKPTQAVGLA